MSKAQKYDAHQFAGRHEYPVSARNTLAGWVSTGVAFEDYTRMNTQQRKPSGERRLPTPKWAVNDPMLRTLLVKFTEERAGFRKAQKGTLLERLERAKVAVIAQRPRLVTVLSGLCKQYVELKQYGKHPELTDEQVLDVAEKVLGAKPLFVSGHPLAAREMLAHKRSRELEIEIEGIDTYLRYTANGGADTVAAIVYLYYRAGYDSVGVGAELGLKPPHVRQTLWRLHDTAKKLWPSQDKDKVASAGEAAITKDANQQPACASSGAGPAEPLFS